LLAVRIAGLKLGAHESYHELRRRDGVKEEDDHANGEVDAGAYGVKGRVVGQRDDVVYDEDEDHDENGAEIPDSNRKDVKFRAEITGSDVEDEGQERVDDGTKHGHDGDHEAEEKHDVVKDGTCDRDAVDLKVEQINDRADAEDARASNHEPKTRALVFATAQPKRQTELEKDRYQKINVKNAAKNEEIFHDKQIYEVVFVQCGCAGAGESKQARDNADQPQFCKGHGALNNKNHG